MEGIGEEYLIQDSRSSCGNCAFWWGPNRSGYVCNIDEAGRYTKEEAESICRNRETDIPHKLSDVLPYVVKHIRVDTNDNKFMLRHESGASRKVRTSRVKRSVQR